MSMMKHKPPTREQHYHQLMALASPSANSHWLAQIIASWSVGDSVLPDALGLDEPQFQWLLQNNFPSLPLAPAAPSRKTLDFTRMLEKQDLEQLLRRYAAVRSAETECMIALIVAACLGNDHLWQDLGLWSRADLSALIKHNFPALADRNNKDMKWKKFLYKQLCEEEGLYVCRAPSCEVCKDYPVCFGPEN